jgi:hypothetical protein
MGGRRGAYRVWWRGLREKDNLEHLAIKGMMILKWVLKKWDWEAWTGLIWREPVSFTVFCIVHLLLYIALCLYPTPSITYILF